MNLEEKILDMLGFPAPGFSFNEIYNLLKRWYEIETSRKTLSRVLKRLVKERRLDSGYVIYPNGQVAKIYTDPLNQKYGWYLTREELLNLIQRKCEKAQKRLYKDSR